MDSPCHVAGVYNAPSGRHDLPRADGQQASFHQEPVVEFPPKDLQPHLSGKQTSSFRTFFQGFCENEIPGR